MFKRLQRLMLFASLLLVLPLLAQEAELLDALTDAYPHEQFDPDEIAWSDLLTHPDYADGELFVLELASFSPDDEEAKASYDSYLDTVLPAFEAAGAQIELVYDIMIEATGDLSDLHGDAYRGGTAYTVRFPSRAAFVDALLDERVINAVAGRNQIVSDVQWMAGTDALPPLFRALPARSADSISTPYVDDKSAEELIDELTAIYPDGGADPTHETLRTLIEWEGFYDTPLHYINLYDWGSYGEAGAIAHDTYNQAAQGTVLQHGVSLTARVEIEHHLAGDVTWDRLILPRWPSFSVFTNLRLVPEYVEAQAYRVESADVYGTYMAIARPVMTEDTTTDE